MECVRWDCVGFVCDSVFTEVHVRAVVVVFESAWLELVVCWEYDVGLTVLEVYGISEDVV